MALKMLKPLLSTGGPKPKQAGWLSQHTTSAASRGYGWPWQQAVKRIRARDHDLCQACIRKGAGYIGQYGAVDHKVPKTEGGSDDDSNLEVLCDPCHADKTAAESMRARGLQPSVRTTFGRDGWPV